MGLNVTIYPGDHVSIGDDITVTMRRISQGGVQLMIGAPASQKIKRHHVGGVGKTDRGQRMSVDQQRQEAGNKLREQIKAHTRHYRGQS